MAAVEQHYSKKYNYTKHVKYKFVQVCPASGYIRFEADILLYSDQKENLAPTCPILKKIIFNSLMYGILLSKFWKNWNNSAKCPTLALFFGALWTLMLKKIIRAWKYSL